MGSIIKITTGIKGINYKIYKSYYQCYSGRRTDYNYEVFSCTGNGEQRVGARENLKKAMELIDKPIIM